jgi:16S rRNA (cytidine1402-2'-O)-methyltransferase
LQALLQTLHPHTRLAVCCALTLPEQTVRSALVHDWKRNKDALAGLPLDAPAVFLLGR